MTWDARFAESLKSEMRRAGFTRAELCEKIINSKTGKPLHTRRLASYFNELSPPTNPSPPIEAQLRQILPDLAPLERLGHARRGTENRGPALDWVENEETVARSTAPSRRVLPLVVTSTPTHEHVWEPAESRRNDPEGSQRFYCEGCGGHRVVSVEAAE
jgi:hypothetical protein